MIALAISSSRRYAAPSSVPAAARFRSPSDSRGLQNVISKLESQGIRLNPQRHALLEYVYTADSNPTVEELVDRFHSLGRGRSLGATAIYSQLRVFERLGLICEWNDGSSAVRYAPAGQGSKAAV